MSLREILDASATELAEHVPFDLLQQGTTDPESGLVDTGWSEGRPRPTLCQVIEAEYGTPDVNKLDWLATRQEPLGLLSVATDGDLDRSHRFRALLRQEALAHELRMALVSRGVRWGYQVIYRSADRQDFSAAETAHVRRIAARLTAILVERAAIIPVGVLPADQVGVLCLNAGGQVDSADDTARRILHRAGAQRCSATRLPVPVASFATALRAGHLHRALMPDPVLGWLRLTGNTLTAYPGGHDRFTISMRAAAPLTIAPYRLYACGVAPRSVAVTVRVLRGMTSVEIAEDLGITAHTVQDHLKPVFTALGVHSRRQLIGALFPGLRPYQLR